MVVLERTNPSRMQFPCCWKVPLGIKLPFASTSHQNLLGPTKSFQYIVCANTAEKNKDFDGTRTSKRLRTVTFKARLTNTNKALSMTNWRSQPPRAGRH
ncbi:hypothetical protein EVAR_87791_1 [Eumeta japonica]|uniref:Uncharacterized protein n=1 Tax=Eumeta variegata TaxID=151549 RepID=A0A4C1X4Z2_EUMVA|nr:hypothetical protein EVAR_87791_1 [Eumeta japonica]